MESIETTGQVSSEGGRKLAVSLAASERERIARRLHRGVGQILTGIGFKMALSYEGDAPIDPETCAEVRGLLKEAVRELSQLTRELGEPPPTTKDFLPRLHELYMGIQRRGRGLGELDVDPTASPQKDEHAVGLFLVAQAALEEAVVVRQAAGFSVHWKQADEWGVLAVSASGLDDADPASASLTETLMMLRTQAMSGRLKIEEESGVRTVECAVPLT